MADEKERSTQGGSTPEGFVAEEPKFMGRVPIRPELEVIPEDPNRPKLNWIVKDYVGHEVYRYSHGRVWTKATLTNRDDLKPGDQIATVALLGGYLLLTVVKDNDGELYGDSDNTIGMLEFDKDDRHCWVCTGHINKRGLARANKTTVVG
jgi:hypothetical protein